MGRRSQNRRPVGAAAVAKIASPSETPLMASMTKDITQAEVKADLIKMQGLQIVSKLEAHVKSLDELAEQYLEQGLLGHHVEALQMRDKTTEKINETRKKFGVPVPSTSSTSVSISPSTKERSPSLSSKVLATSSASCQQVSEEVAMSVVKESSPSLMCEQPEEEWCVLAAPEETLAATRPRYRWREGDGDECTLEVRGNTSDIDVDISDRVIRLQWPIESENVTLRLPLGFITDPENCRAVRRRKADELKLIFPRVADIPPQAPLLSEALTGEDGFGFIDGFVVGREADTIRSHLVHMWKTNQMQAGEIAGGDVANEGRLRSDKHVYTDEKDPLIMKFTNRLDRFIMQFVKQVPDLKSVKLMRGRPMAAVYSGVGARYVPHFDAVAGDNGRLITCILYLNPFWQDGDGAQLRLWPRAKSLQRDGECRDIAPLHGRLTVFLCNSRNLHEVLPVADGEQIEPRVAISCWYYDSDAIPAIAESQLTGDAPLL